MCKSKIIPSHIVSPHSKHCTSQLWWGSHALQRHITYCITTFKALHLSTLVRFTCTTETHHILYHHIQSTAPLNFGGVHMHYIDTSHIVSPHSKHCTSQLWWGSHALQRHITYSCVCEVCMSPTLNSYTEIHKSF